MKNKIAIGKDKSLLLKGGKILDITNGKTTNKDILIHNGKIVKIGKISDNNNYHIIDCKNNIITQSFIDIHSHFHTPGVGDQETLISGSNAALSGGYSKVCIMPNTNPVIDTPELVDLIIDEAKKLPIDIYPIGSITKKLEGTELAEIGSMVNSGAVAISDASFPIMNGQVMRYALEYAKMFNVPVINHPQDINLVNNGVMNECKTSNSLGLEGNPTISESIMINRDLEIANYIKGKLHVPNITCADSVDLIDKYKNKNLLLTCEVSPQNLFFSDNDLIDYDTNFKISPPLRSLNDRNKLIKGLKDGVIDCIASCHYPQRNDDKEKDFNHSEFGVISLETAFAATNTILNQENFSLKSILELFSLNPSKILNIALSEIKISSNAELVVINPNEEWIFNKNDIYSKSSNTPFIKKAFKGKIKYTINKNILFG